MRLLLLLPAVLLCACLPSDPGQAATGGPSTPTAGSVQWGVRAGARLRPVLLFAEDQTTVAQPDVLYDSMTSHQCAFEVAEDNRLRCLPVTRTAPNNFLDAACTAQYAVVRRGGEAPRFAVKDLGSDPTRRQIYSLGAEVRPATFFRIAADGVCTGQGFPADFLDTYAIYPITRVPPEQFVAAESRALKD